MAFAGLRLAAGTLTVIPSGAIPEIDRPIAARAMILAPVAVLPLAAGSAVVAWLAQGLNLPPLLVGLLVVGTLALGTRAMHLDGLADTVDGLGSGWDPARALQIMRQGDVGPMGVVALVIVLGLQAASIGWLADDLRGALLVGLVVCCSRAALTLVCRRGVPAARGEGLGAAVAGSVPWPATALVWLLVAAILGLVQLRWGAWPVSGVLAALAAAVVVQLLVRRCVRRFGGVTGDVMGAAIEISLTIMLVGVSL
jgi:adenosylcobinamide-GDP ribazoletransferase